MTIYSSQRNNILFGTAALLVALLLGSATTLSLGNFMGSMVGALIAFPGVWLISSSKLIAIDKENGLVIRRTRSFFRASDNSVPLDRFTRVRLTGHEVTKYDSNTRAGSPLNQEFIYTVSIVGTREVEDIADYANLADGRRKAEELAEWLELELDPET